jgi:hypothetical protein
MDAAITADVDAELPGKSNFSLGVSNFPPMMQMERFRWADY